MSEYTHIKSDCDRVSEGLGRAVNFLKVQKEWWQEDPESEFYNPEWDVHLEQEEIDQLINFLTGVQGLLFHLGNNPDAACNLLQQHLSEEVAA